MPNVRADMTISLDGYISGLAAQQPPYLDEGFFRITALIRKGGTTFHFVTDGLAGAIERAKVACGDRDVHISGGAKIVQQAIA